MIGTSIGPYEITGKLGEGGMGQVWRARDFHLGREVALKVLPEGFTSDPERLARFEREAKLLAQLNHPNIAQIYGFEASGATRALVMELVEGPTLAERLEQGPFPFNESLAVSLQIAHALEEAHEKGIVHRDLKPQNIKASIEGKVKVLDFGLAKALDPAGGSAMSPPELAQSPTLTFGGTREGVILGTAAYMSPEQARGLAVDKRADIWAFGVVLYEMLAGARLFTGESVVDTLSSVLRKEIDLSRLPEATPPRVRELMRRCLERDPRLRLRDIGEARVVLSEPMASPADVASSSPRSSQARRGSFAVVTALIAAGSFLAGRQIAGPVPALETALQPRAFQQLTDLAGVESAPSLAPDGESVVYVAGPAGSRDIFLLRVGGRNPVALTADFAGDDWQPAFSPDGKSIAFRSEREGGGIFRMEATGESVRRLTDSGYDPTWSPDGKRVAFTHTAVLYPTDRPAASRGLSSVDLETGVVTEISRAGDVVRPSWSPGGSRIAYWGLSGGGGRRNLFTVAADGSEATQGGVEVTSDPALDWSPVWSPDGRYLYFSSDRGGAMNLWRVRVDEQTGRRLSEAEPVTTPSLWSGTPSFSRDGSRMAFATLDWRSRLVRSELDPAAGRMVGEPRLIVQSTRPIRDHQTSPDGASIAFVQMGIVDDLFVVRRDGAQLRRLTDDAFRDRGPAWSPDGARIAFFTDRSGIYQIWTVRPDGSGFERWTDFSAGVSNPVWSPDGRRLAITAFGAGTEGWHLVEADSAALPKLSSPGPVIPGGEGRFQPTSWTPDGGRIAGFQIRTDGRVGGIFVYRLADRSFTEVGGASPAFWRCPIWLHDGRRLLVRDERSIAILDTETGANRTLLEVGGYTFGMSVGVGPDDRSITYTETATEGDIWLAEMGREEKAPSSGG